MNAPVIGEVVQVSSSRIQVLLSLDSMEINHHQVADTVPGDAVAVKVSESVREGDDVFRVD